MPKTPSGAPTIEAVRDGIGTESSLDDVIETLLGWIDGDRKTSSLKTLQGLIWEAGYQRGELRSHLYIDVDGVLRVWHARDIGIYCYSSGSIHAQRLYFRHSDAGDLTRLFSGYFDTTTGPKQAAESYTKIAAAIGVVPGETLFLSDAEAELDAATQAGFAVCQILREGVTANTQGYAMVADFEHIDINAF